MERENPDEGEGMSEYVTNVREELCSLERGGIWFLHVWHVVDVTPVWGLQAEVVSREVGLPEILAFLFCSWGLVRCSEKGKFVSIILITLL